MDRAAALNVKKGRSSKWLYLVLPANIAWGPISTLITLYILSLGGTVIDVAYAITLGSAVAIPAAYFWGKVSDIYNRRKALILISFFGLSICLIGFLFTKTVLGVTLLYAVLNFLYYANGTPLNLLVMEHSPKSKWASTFSKLQMITSAGATVGFVIAAVVTGFVHLDDLIIALFLISVVSIVLTAKFLYEPAIKLRMRAFVDVPFIMVSRVFVHPLMLFVEPKVSSFNLAVIPKLSMVKRLFSIGRGGDRMHNYVLMLYAASFIFYVGSGFFNTSYPAGLNQIGLTESNVFLVLFIGILIQTITFNYSDIILKRGARRKIVIQSLALRGASYAVLGAAFYLALGPTLGTGTAFLVINMLFYALASGLAYSVYYTISNTMFFESIGNLDRGSALGIYAAVTGVGVLLGSFLSGYTSYYVGYWLTFFIAGALIFWSAYMFKRLPPEKQSQDTSGTPASRSFYKA